MHPFSCCVTGHRDIPSHQIPRIEQALREEIRLALAEGCRHFISGFARGADMVFVRLALEEGKAYGHVIVEAALPYPGWMDHRSAGDKNLLNQCIAFRAHSDAYAPDCFAIRNRYMVDTCSRILAVYDGRQKGGTAGTIRYAERLNREIRILSVE